MNSTDKFLTATLGLAFVFVLLVVDKLYSHNQKRISIMEQMVRSGYSPIEASCALNIKEQSNPVCHAYIETLKGEAE